MTVEALLKNFCNGKLNKIIYNDKRYGNLSVEYPSEYSYFSDFITKYGSFNVVNWKYDIHNKMLDVTIK